MLHWHTIPPDPHTQTFIVKIYLSSKNKKEKWEKEKNLYWRGQNHKKFVISPLTCNYVAFDCLPNTFSYGVYILATSGWYSFATPACTTAASYHTCSTCQSTCLSYVIASTINEPQVDYTHTYTLHITLVPEKFTHAYEICIYGCEVVKVLV